MSFIEKLPNDLRRSAYQVSEEAAWPRNDAIRVIDHLSRLNMFVCRIEIWLATSPGPTIPTPFIYTWEIEDKSNDEELSEYIKRANNQAKTFITTFNWDDRDTGHQKSIPYFNLEVCHENSDLSE
jgi:hypothetical protein